MKRLFLFIAIACFASFAKAQGTTQEEYNYVSKGYKIQVESGLDMKKGYKIVETERMLDDVQVKFLFRESDQTLAATIIVWHAKFFNKDYYVCLPNSKASKELWQSFYISMNELGGAAVEIFHGTVCLLTNCSGFYSRILFFGFRKNSILQFLIHFIIAEI